MTKPLRNAYLITGNYLVDIPRARDDRAGISPEMISAADSTYESFDPRREDPEALVFVIIHQAFVIAKRNSPFRFE